MRSTAGTDDEPGARGHARKPKAWLAPRRLPVKAWPDAFAGRALRGNLSARMQIAEPAIGCPTHAASAPASSCALRACVVVQPNVFLNERQNALWRSEEHTSELQSLMRISYAVLCLKKKKEKKQQ